MGNIAIHKSAVSFTYERHHSSTSGLRSAMGTRFAGSLGLIPWSSTILDKSACCCSVEFPEFPLGRNVYIYTIITKVSN